MKRKRKMPSHHELTLQSKTQQVRLSTGQAGRGRTRSRSLEFFALLALCGRLVRSDCFSIGRRDVAWKPMDSARVINWRVCRIGLATALASTCMRRRIWLGTTKRCWKLGRVLAMNP